MVPPPPTWTAASLFGGAFCSRHHHPQQQQQQQQQQSAGNTKDSDQKNAALVAKVRLLDDKDLVLNIDTKSLGRHLLDLVCQNINLIENSYFGLEFLDEANQFRWLDNEKPIVKQTTKLVFVFSVKFYVPDPTQLQCEYTRYLFALQIRRDLAQGVLACAENTAVLLSSYIAQAEYGSINDDDDVDSPSNPRRRRANSFSSSEHQPQWSPYGNRRFFHHQTEEHERKILALHRKHSNLTPTQADYQLLDIARKIDFYGLRLKPGCDHDGIALELTVSHQGLAVFQGLTRINTFPWARIRKICFKRKKFLVKLQPDNYGYYKDTIEFYFASKSACKCFWKSCIENHSFFRLCVAWKPSSMQVPLNSVMSVGSSGGGGGGGGMSAGCDNLGGSNSGGVVGRNVQIGPPAPARKTKRMFLPKGSSFRYVGLTFKETMEQTKIKLINDTDHQESAFIRLQRENYRSTPVSNKRISQNMDRSSPQTTLRHRGEDECYSSTHGSRTIDTHSSLDMSSCSDIVAVVSEFGYNNNNINAGDVNDDGFRLGDERGSSVGPVEEVRGFNGKIEDRRNSPVRQLFNALLNLSDSTTSSLKSEGFRDCGSRKLDLSSSPVYRTSSSPRQSSQYDTSSAGEDYDDLNRHGSERRRQFPRRSLSRNGRCPPSRNRRRRTQHRSVNSRHPHPPSRR